MGYFDNYFKMEELYKALLRVSKNPPNNPNVNWDNIRSVAQNMMYDLSDRVVDDYHDALEAGDIGYNEYNSDIDSTTNMINSLWRYGYMQHPPVANYDPEYYIGTKMSVVPKDSGFIKPILDSASDAYELPSKYMNTLYHIPMVKDFHTEPYDDYNDLIVESNLPHANTALARWFKNRGK